jgi:hypothetical protein
MKMAFIAVILSIAALFLSAPDVFSAAEKEVGNVRDIHGNANIVREREKIDVYKNESVFRADTVKTLEKSRVKILFVDDSLLMLGENSSVFISEHLKKGGGESIFNLTDGVLNVIVGKKGFKVHTPTAISSARGTSFLVWVENGKTNMAVTEGRVDFSNADEKVSGKLVIPAGKMSSIESGKPPTPAVIAPPEVIKVLYRQTLEEKERWGPVILRAKGSAIAPPHITNPAQAKLMALRAAKVEAMRNLLEQAQGVTIMGESTIQDFALKSDVIKSRVDSFIKGAWVSEERLLADGSYEVEMEIGLGIGFRRMFIEKAEEN